MEPVHHDEVLAATSHLPHVLAFTLVESLARLQDKREIFEYAAGGFRDFTRIASSDPVMWRDICLANSDAIQAMIERFIGDLQVLDRPLRRVTASACCRSSATPRRRATVSLKNNLPDASG